MIKSRAYESYILEESKKKHEDESKKDAAEDTADVEMEEDLQVPVVTPVNNILH